MDSISYFGEKTPQISVYSMDAFGIEISTRHGKARELAELLMFAKTAAEFDVHKYVKSAFYDSNSDSCTFEFTEKLSENSLNATLILEAARSHISQFIWFGHAEHGGDNKPDEE